MQYTKGFTIGWGKLKKGWMSKKGGIRSYYLLCSKSMQCWKVILEGKPAEMHAWKCCLEDLFFWLLTVSCSFILVQCFCIGSIRKRNEKYYKPNLLLPRSISSHDFVKLISINGWWVSSQLHFLPFWSHLFCKIKCHMKLAYFKIIIST